MLNTGWLPLRYLTYGFRLQDPTTDDGTRRARVALVVLAGARTGRRRRAWMDAPERITHTDQQPAGGRVADGVRQRSGPELYQAGRN